MPGFQVVSDWNKAKNIACATDLKLLSLQIMFIKAKDRTVVAS